MVGKPRYMEIVDWVKERLEKKELGPGERLNSENELSELFGLSRQTVRHAIGVLEEEGIVVRRQGSGTYVCDDRMATLENKTRIAVVTTYVDSYIFPRTIQGIENYLFERGYSVQIAFTNNMLERERTILEDILARDDVAGIIMEATKSGLPNPNLSLIARLVERKVPIVFINSYYPQLKLPHVTLNDRLAAEMAVKYLFDAGHRRIGALLKFDDGQGHLFGNKEAVVIAEAPPAHHQRPQPAQRGQDHPRRELRLAPGKREVGFRQAVHGCRTPY